MRIIKQKNSKTKKISVPKGTAFLGSRRVILRKGEGTQSCPLRRVILRTPAGTKSK